MCPLKDSDFILTFAPWVAFEITIAYKGTEIIIFCSNNETVGGYFFTLSLWRIIQHGRRVELWERLLSYALTVESDKRPTVDCREVGGGTV